MRKSQISIVIPCFNQSKYLFESVGSLAHADELIREIIVVNDGSTHPSTRSEIKEIERRFPKVKTIHQTNQGLSAARNAGAAVASGLYVQFLDADDLIAPGKLHAQVAHFALANELEVSITDYLLCDEFKSEFSGSNTRLTRGFFEARDFLFLWERGFVIPIHSALFNKNLLKSVNFSIDASAKEDWIFWSTIALQGRKMSYLPRLGAIYRQGQQSMRQNWEKMSKSWLHAIDVIEPLCSKEFPTFRPEALRWHDDIYLPNLNKALKGKNKEPILNTPDEPIQNIPQLPSHTLTPLFSVIVLVFNHFEKLFKCFDSLSQQSYREFEVVCVNDASDDPRVGEFLTKLSEKNPQMRLVSHEENMGISNSQNEAVRLAKGKFVAFLDCDDYFAPTALEEIQNQIRDNSTTLYYFTDRIDIDQNDKQLRVAKYGGYNDIKISTDHRAALLFGMVASHLKVLDRKTYLELGGVNEKYSGVQDWELALEFARTGEMKYLPRPLYYHRIHSTSVTSSAAVSQFRKTNEVRRREQAIRYEKTKNRCTLQAKQAWPLASRDEVLSQLPNPIIVDSNTFTWSHSALIELADQPALVAFNALGVYDQSVVNRCREFNSFFDLILVDDIRCWIALQGYLWGEILILVSPPLAGHLGSPAPS